MSRSPVLWILVGVIASLVAVGAADDWLKLSGKCKTGMRMRTKLVLQILVGLLPGWQMPRFSVPADRRLTIPYGAAITIGAIIATAIFHP